MNKERNEIKEEYENEPNEKNIALDSIGDNNIKQNLQRTLNNVKSIERIPDLMIIPKTKEELYIESLPFAERSAFSRARMNKGSLQSSGQKIAEIGTNSLKGRKPLSTTFVDDIKDITRSSIGTDAKPRFISKR